MQGETAGLASLDLISQPWAFAFHSVRECLPRAIDLWSQHTETTTFSRMMFLSLVMSFIESCLQILGKSTLVPKKNRAIHLASVEHSVLVDLWNHFFLKDSPKALL